MIGETLLQIGLYIVVVINTVLLFVVLSRGIFNTQNIVFALFNLSTAAWTGAILGFYYFRDYALVLDWVVYTHLFALSTAILFLYFTFFFPQNLFRGKGKTMLLLPAGVFGIFAYALLTSGVIITGTGTIAYHLGPGYIFYALALMLSFFIGYGYLLRQYKEAKTPIQKKQTLYVGIGGVIAPTLAIIPDLILPYFGVFNYTWMGPPFTLIMVVALFIAMVRFHLFNIKVITTEIFANLIIIILLAQLFLASSATVVVITAIVLVLVAVLAYVLIRSVYREVEQREEIQRLAENLKVANEKLKELDKLKSQFLSIASHDLRSPLTVIRNFISLLLDGTYGKVPDAAQEGLHQIFERATEMAHSVDNYLNVSRIEQGRMKYEFAEADLVALVRDAVSAFKIQAEAKGLTLNMSLSGAMDSIPVKVDKASINEVLNNLLDNAIKYTPKGSIFITLEKEGTMARISVKDSGKGVTEKTKENLFKLFSPGEDSKKMNPNSTGVGLYITKAHVEAHGGKIWVDSEGEGKGSTFIVELPILKKGPLAAE